MHKLILCIFSLISVSTFAQVGGKNSFDFINASSSARLSALGGVNVSLADRDVNFFAANPALVGDSLAGSASASYQFYVADIGQSFFSYVHNFKKIGLLSFGIQHIGYGAINGYDENGIETSKFNSGETAIIVSKSQQAGNFRLGANVKAVFSAIAGYKASALMMDLGGVFIHPQKQFTVGMTIKNIGFVTQQYSSGARSKLPFDVQLGTTFKPVHMPLRFSLTAFNLRPDATYYFPNPDQKKGTTAKILSHINLGTEILVHKHVNVMIGYNYLIHQTLKLSGGRGAAGLSYGFSASVRSFEFIFSRNAYVAGNAGYSFTLSTNVNKLLTRRQRV